MQLMIAPMIPIKNFVNKFKLHLLLLLVFPALTGCAQLVDEIQFKVMSTGAGFTGYYIVDSREPKYFEDDSNVSGNFSYSKNAGELKFIEINAQNKVGALSVTIKVYRNDVKVKEIALDAITGTKNLNLTYKFREEENAPKP